MFLFLTAVFTALILMARKLEERIGSDAESRRGGQAAPETRPAGGG